MAKSGMNKFMDFLKLSDPEEDFDDDLFEDDKDDDYYDAPRKKAGAKDKSYYDDLDDDYEYKKPKAKPSRAASPSKLVSINSRNNSRGNSQVHVIRPQEFNGAQEATDYLKEGMTVIINLEGIEVHAAQRIIDFIGGACYALDGSLQAITGNSFVAAPHNVDVSGDLREEILNESTISPELIGSF